MCFKDMKNCLKQDKLYCTGLITLVIAGILMGLIFWWLVQPFNQIKVNSPFPVLNENQEVSRGQQLIYLVQYQKTRDIPTSANRFIECEDGNLVTLVSGDSTLPSGNRILTASVRIPEKTSLTECVFSTVVTFHINPLKSVVKTYQTEPFKVVE